MSGKTIRSCLSSLMIAVLVAACGGRGTTPASLQPVAQVSTPMGGGSGRMAYTSYRDKHYLRLLKIGLQGVGAQAMAAVWIDPNEIHASLRRGVGKRFISVAIIIRSSHNIVTPI
jgi:hypothetical protein